VASYDRYLAIRQHADTVDRQALFGAFLDLVEGLGWRVTAICELRASDVDLSVTEARPYGRLHKRAETDKMGVQQWVPMSAPVRAAILAVLDRNPVMGEAPLFPLPVSLEPRGHATTRGHSWTAPKPQHGPQRSSGMMQRQPQHSPRSTATTSTLTDAHGRLRGNISRSRMWRRLVDGVRPMHSLRCYTQADEATMLAVVSEPRKVRSVGA
jgi:integrase